MNKIQIQTRISELKKTIRKVASSDGDFNYGALDDARESLSHATKMLDRGDLNRAHELVVLADEQVDASTAVPS